MRTFYLQMTEKGPDSVIGWLLFLLLWPLSRLYGLVVTTRKVAYRAGIFKSYRADIPVISVGNLTVGGTGKTPVVDALVKYLTNQGKKVAIVSRGYGGSFTGDVGHVLSSGSEHALTAAEAGDEPFLLATRNPDADVFIARKRRLGVDAAEARGADCIVLDDAFQHLAVARDLDIVLLDSRAPFGNGSLLPAGNLRESRKALHRADLLVLTHADKKASDLSFAIDTVSCTHRFAEHFVDLKGQLHPWTRIGDKRCLAFAGIARPDDFFKKLRDKGCQLVGAVALADHQEYSHDVVERINRACQNIDYLLTTEKDIVKLQGLTFPVPCLAVPLELEFSHFAVIEEKLSRIFGGSRD